MTKQLAVDDQKTGDNCPCFIIAEAGVNHNGSLEMACKLVDAAAQSGANAVKFQTFKAAKLVTTQAPTAEYQQQNTGNSESQYQMLKRLELSAEAHQELFAYCHAQNILFMSTPFDEDSADFLDELGVGVFKVPSGEITNLPFLTHLAKKKKPLIVSTGMATLGEVETAVQTIEATGNTNFALLHCVSNYPADPANVNLRAMHTLQTAFGVSVGFSDHTLGIEIPLAAVAMGATIIEKHFTLDNTMPGPDHKASLEPAELKAMVQGIRKVESALGNGRKTPAASESDTATVARKSLVAAGDLAAGTILTTEMIAIKRPGSGLPPAMLPYLLDRSLRYDVAADTLLSLDMLQ